MEADDNTFGAWPVLPDGKTVTAPAEAWADGSSLNNGQPDAAAGAGVFSSADNADNISQPLTPAASAAAEGENPEEDEDKEAALAAQTVAEANLTSGVPSWEDLPFNM